MHTIAILGSTGSIGQNTLDVIARHPDRFRVEALTAHKNVALLFRQCQQFKPRYAVISDETLAAQLKIKLREEKINTDVLFGADAIVQVAKDSGSTIVMAAIVGAAGLLPTLSAIEMGKRVLLANKESLVMAADLFMRTVRLHQTTLLPVDSEHNAIFQCLPDDFLPGKKAVGVQSIILTASGGPFRTTPLQELKHVTPQQAIKHPNWMMGAKISVDSATMMNKGLEVIEAFWLFGLSIEQIQVVIHPQSTVHSLVVFEDASLLAQLGCPDMRIPIAHTLAWPDRITSGAKRLDLTAMGRLDFEPISFERFPCLRLAFQALKAGGTATTVLNAANEIAVHAFCAGQLRFDHIATVIDAVMQKSDITIANDLNVILQSDQKARELTTQIIKESVYC